MTVRPASWVRDHLANERTLMAWVRAALTFMAFGVALAKAGLFLRIAAADHPQLASELPVAAHSEAFGVALVAVGGLIAIAGTVKSRRWARIIDPTGPVPRERALMFLALLTVCTSVALIIYLVL